MISQGEFNKNFAANLTYYMDLNGKSRKDLAKDLKVGYTTVCDWCNGKTAPQRTNTLDRLCAYFGCKRSDLLDKPVKDDLSELDALLAQISVKGDDLDTRFIREYIELSASQKALILDVMRQFKKD